MLSVIGPSECRRLCRIFSTIPLWFHGVSEVADWVGFVPKSKQESDLLKGWQQI